LVGWQAQAKPPHPAITIAGCLAIALWAAVTMPAIRTSAKSRTRLSRRLAMRGVPRARNAISAAPAGVSGTPRICADRARIVSRSVAS